MDYANKNGRLSKYRLVAGILSIVSSQRHCSALGAITEKCHTHYREMTYAYLSNTYYDSRTRFVGRHADSSVMNAPSAHPSPCYGPSGAHPLPRLRMIRRAWRRARAHRYDQVASARRTPESCRATLGSNAADFPSARAAIASASSLSSASMSSPGRACSKV